MLELNIVTHKKYEGINITSEVVKFIAESNVKNGICYLLVPHTTAGITINEGADPKVLEDIVGAVDSIIPTRYEFKHWGGNSPSHLKSSLFGTTLTILVRDGKPVLGEWQAIIFLEFDGPRKRKAIIELLPVILKH